MFRRPICAFLVFACAFLFVPIAFADSAKSVSPAVSIVGGALQTFAAAQPFHVSHGWLVQPSGDQALGKFRFSLAIDGVEVRPDFIETIRSDDAVFGTLLFNPYVFNFADGLTGTHVFAGTFLGPCQDLVDGGFASGPCPNPNAIVPTSASPFATTVSFVP